MQSTGPVSVLVDFASQINFSHHSYVKEKDKGGFALTQEKANRQDFQNLIRLVTESPNHSAQQKEVRAALDTIQSHLTNKISGVFSFFIGKEDKQRIQGMIDDIEAIKPKLEASPAPTTEGEARLKFYAELPKKLRVKDAATQDLPAVKAVSQKVWERCENYDEYSKHMTMFFEGEHILFEEEDQVGQEYGFYNELKDAGAYLRGSSHYDHGTLNGKTGGPVPLSADQVANPQYEIEGPQIKALLVGRVKLALKDDDTPIFGKTFEEAVKEAEAKKETPPTKSKKYTFMQTEWAPDSDSYLSGNFWKHRVLSFVLYAGRKLLGNPKPNVGPYGYGHGDKGNTPESNPTVIPVTIKK